MPFLPPSFGASCPPPPPNVTFTYGTSGFRGVHSTLPSTCYRMGILAVLRSLSFSRSDSPVFPIVGVMVTASHNECHDNGMKIVDPNGEMMSEKWESAATKLANSKSEDVVRTVEEITAEFGIEIKGFPFEINPTIFIGEDTRESSPILSDLVSQGVMEMGGTVKRWGLCSTPQIHWITQRANKAIEEQKHKMKGATNSWYRDHVNPHVEMSHYYQQTIESFHAVLSLSNCTPSPPSLSPLQLDCSYGVGALAAETMTAMEDSSHRKFVLPLILINSDMKQTEKLNENCGAEFVQKSKLFPFKVTQTESDVKMYSEKKMASFDGDADRLVYYYMDVAHPTQTKLALLDGDKIIALFTTFFQSLLQKAEPLLSPFPISIGIVQTAYANGSSTHYIDRSLKVPVVFTPTGVKYLQHEGKKYDIGIYFEANGHGTVLFSKRIKEKVSELFIHHKRIHRTLSAAERSIAIIHHLINLINQTVGDALCDMLVVECALHYLQWDITKWHSLYSDIPSVMLKVKVPDRNAVITTNAERTCVKPEGLQQEIDKLVNLGFRGGEGEVNRRRAFVRPSGTEDVVRVYAEAPTDEEAKTLADGVARAVANAFAMK